MTKIIEVKNLKKTFAEIHAVDNVTFDVEKGELFALLGVNGAGKSTIINILCSILKKDGGDIKIDGEDLGKSKEKIGIVFQNSVLDTRLTVLDNLCSRAALYGMNGKVLDERISFLSEVFQLEKLLNRPLGKLSGGQRRKVDIARALLHKPEILFLDEPTTGLDPQTRLSVWHTIHELIKLGLTVFLTTHYMEEAVRANNVVVIDSGKIVANGTPNELKEKFAYDYLRIVEKQKDEIESALYNQKFEFEYKNSAYIVKMKDSFSAAEFVLAHKNIISDFEILKGDMDDVFLNVTGKSLDGTGTSL